MNGSYPVFTTNSTDPFILNLCKDSQAKARELFPLALRRVFPEYASDLTDDVGHQLHDAMVRTVLKRQEQDVQTADQKSFRLSDIFNPDARRNRLYQAAKIEKTHICVDRVMRDYFISSLSEDNQVDAVFSDKMEFQERLKKVGSAVQRLMPSRISEFMIVPFL